MHTAVFGSGRPSRRSREGRGAKPPDFERVGNPKRGPKWSQIYQKITRTSLENPPLLHPLKAFKGLGPAPGRDGPAPSGSRSQPVVLSALEPVRRS